MALEAWLNRVGRSLESPPDMRFTKDFGIFMIMPFDFG
jgi:hypothetical protein